MSGLGLLWTVRHYSGSFATAGIVVGAFAFGEALLGPQAARAMDRYGQTRILPLLVAVHAIALALLVVGVARIAPVAGLCVAAVLAGGSIPQSGSLSAVRWVYVLADPDLLVTAFSLEAVANDVAFLVGPAVVVAIGALTWPVLGTVIAAALVLGGGVGLALQNSSAPPPAPRIAEGQLRACDSGVRCLFSRGFVALLVVNVALGALFGTLQVAVSATVVDHHAVALGGVVYAVMSVTSLISGLVYGSIRRPWPPRRVLLVLSAYLVVATGLLQVTTGMVALAVGLGLIGVAVAPLLVVSAVLTEQVVPAGALTQAFAWLGSASAAGLAIAAAGAGAAIQAHGTSAGFLTATTAAITMVLAAIVGRHHLSPTPQDAHRRTTGAP